MFRKRGRTSFQCAMQLKHKQIGAFEVTTRDVSASGMFIGFPPAKKEAWAALNVGDKVVADVENSENRNETLELTVMRVAVDGFGISYA